MASASCGRSVLNSWTKSSKRACCCRLFIPGGRVASFFSVRCMRSSRPFCCGWPGLMRSMAMPRRSHHTESLERLKRPFWLANRTPLSDQELADPAGTPMGLVALGRDDQAFDLPRQLVGVANRRARAVGQRLETVFLVALEDLVAGLARNAERATALAHRFAVQQPSDEPQALVHHRTLLPRHPSLPRKGERCYPCVRYDLSPMSRAAHSANLTSPAAWRGQARMGSRLHGIASRAIVAEVIFVLKTSAGPAPEAEAVTAVLLVPVVRLALWLPGH